MGGKQLVNNVETHFWLTSPSFLHGERQKREQPLLHSKASSFRSSRDRGCQVGRF